MSRQQQGQDEPGREEGGSGRPGGLGSTDGGLDGAIVAGEGVGGDHGQIRSALDGEAIPEPPDDGPRKKKFVPQPPRKRKKIGQKRKKSSFDYESAKEGLGLDPSAGFSKVWAACKARTTPAPPSVVVKQYSPSKEVVKQQLRLANNSLISLKEQYAQKHSEHIAERRRADVATDQIARMEVETNNTEREMKTQIQRSERKLKRELKQSERSEHQLKRQLKETERAKTSQKKSYLRQQGEINRRHRSQMKEQTMMHLEECGKLKEKFEQELVNKNVATMELCKLDDLIGELEKERDVLKGKVTAKERHCTELAHQLHLEKKASRSMISKAIGEAEDLMQQAGMIIRDANEKEIALRDMEHTSQKVKRQIVTKAVSDGKQNVKKAIQHERRISARHRAAGEFNSLCFFLSRHEPDTHHMPINSACTEKD